MSTSSTRVAALTGATGYLGQAVARALEANGWTVHSLSRRPGPGRRAFQLGEKPAPGTLHGVDALVHCAYDFAPVHWKDIHRINVEGSRVLFDAACSAGVPRIAYVSSISAYDQCRALYGRAKLAIERDAAQAGAAVVRPGLIWADPPGGTFGNLVNQVANASVLPLIGSGNQVQYLVHRDDLSRLLVEACEGGVSLPAGPVTVAHPQPWTFRALLRAIGRGMGQEPRLVPTPWRVIWAGLKLTEALRVPLAFRSDSVVSLMYQNPRPDLLTARQLGVRCRGFPVSGSWRG